MPLCMYATALRKLFPVLVLFSSLTASAQAKEGAHIVPVAVEQKFSIEQPDVSPRWTREGGLYKATFVNPVNNLGYMITYDETGKVIKREKELEQQEYPPLIAQYHEKKFPGEGLAVWASVDSAGHVRYFSQKNNSLFWFDKDGRPLNAAADSLRAAGR